jgi:integrase/recombinase XerD
MAAIFRRGGSRQWWGRVQRQGKDHRKSLATTSKGVAQKRLASWLDEFERTAWGERPRHTFDDMALKFIDDHLPTLKPKSQRRYRVSIEILTDSFEGLYLDEIGKARLADFADARRKAGARIPEKWLGKRRPKGISPATVRRDLACLSSMFGCAMEWEWTEVNPVPAFLKARKKRGLKESPPKTRWLRHEEERRLLAAARSNVAEPPLHDAICLAIDTGMRSDELFGLKQLEVSLVRNQIELSTGTKNSRPREIPLLPRAREILARLPTHLRSPYVLVNPETGTRYLQLSKGLAGAVKRAGIERLTWHDLRRTCGCRLLQDHRLSMEHVSRWLGHSSVLVTERAYAFLETEHLHAAIASAAKIATAGDLQSPSSFPRSQICTPSRRMGDRSW